MRVGHVSIHSVMFMQHWSKLEIQGDSCPVGRSDHASVCLGYGGDHPQLLITDGNDDSYTPLSNVWLLGLESGRWREVRVGECVRLGTCK